MGERAEAGTWVEVHAVVLEPGERAPQVPVDTKGVALEMTVKGVLVANGALGEEVEITTPAGRRIRGRLTAINPPYTHRFGSPIPELVSIGNELRSALRDKRHPR